jgi:hypothetical protein
MARLLLALLMTLSTINAVAADASPSEMKMRSRFADMAPHPRIIIPSDTNAWQQRIEADSFLRGAHRHMLELAEKYLDEAPITRTMKGRRMLSASRVSLARTSCLAASYRLTGDARFLKRARAEMLSSAAFTDWNPSHFLDTAEMTAALAIGYDWLHDELPASERQTIRRAIIEKGLLPSFESKSRCWWITAHNNWNPVCHAGMTLGALAIADDEPELAARVIARAVESVPIAMAEYAPHGAYPEGPGYWVYGTTYNVLLISALQTALGTDCGLIEQDAFLKTADYPLHMMGPSGMWFNHSDCGTKAPRCPAAALYWFAAQRHDASLLWHAATGAKGDPKGLGRFEPFALAWSDGTAPSAPTALSYRADGPTPIATHRTSWTDPNAVFVGIKAGGASESHAHMDAGSFVVDAGGLRWAADLGMQNYHSLESKGLKIFGRDQNAERWRIYRMNASSHNTLTVNGAPHPVKGRAVILEHSEIPQQTTRVDLSDVFTTDLAKANRRITLNADHSVTIEDDLTGGIADATVRWAMVTPAEVTIESPRAALLKQQGKTMRVTLDGVDSTWQILSTTPPEPYDAPNPDTCMLAFNITLPADQRVRPRVTLAMVD